MPASPSRAETAPSCITPSPDSAGSSSCSAITPPHSRWYWSALRSIPAETTGLPSSVKPSAPASRSSAISVSSSPCRPRVIAARKPTGTRACRGARVDQRPEHARVVDDRVGVRHRDHRAEAAGGGGRACRVVDVLLVLLARRAQVDVRVDERREQRACRPRRAVSPSSGGAQRPGAPSSAISPSRIRMSRGSSSSVRGSSTWAPRISSSAGGVGAAIEPRLAHARPPPGSASRRAARRAPPSAPRPRPCTCSPISACGESIASADSSTPRLTGPGCISSWPGRRRPALIW